MTVAGVALGGALGALARYGLGTWVTPRNPTHRFPIATFLINVTGSLVLGFVFTYFVRRFPDMTAVRLSLTVGFLGAYTTFSTFSLETLRLIEDGFIALAALYVTASVVAALLAVYLGVVAARAV